MCKSWLIRVRGINLQGQDILKKMKNLGDLDILKQWLAKKQDFVQPFRNEVYKSKQTRNNFITSLFLIGKWRNHLKVSFRPNWYSTKKSVMKLQRRAERLVGVMNCKAIWNNDLQISKMHPLRKSANLVNHWFQLAVLVTWMNLFPRV